MFLLALQETQCTRATTNADGTTTVEPVACIVRLDPGQVEYLANVQQADTLAILGVMLLGLFFLVGPLVFNSMKGK